MICVVCVCGGGGWGGLIIILVLILLQSNLKLLVWRYIKNYSFWVRPSQVCGNGCTMVFLSSLAGSGRSVSPRSTLPRPSIEIQLPSPVTTATQGNNPVAISLGEGEGGAIMLACM